MKEKLRVDYKEKRKQCNRVIRKCKRDWMDSKIKQIEDNSKTKNTKKFYQKIKEQVSMERIFQGITNRRAARDNNR